MQFHKKWFHISFSLVGIKSYYIVVYRNKNQRKRLLLLDIDDLMPHQERAYHSCVLVQQSQLCQIKYCINYRQQQKKGGNFPKLTTHTIPYKQDSKFNWANMAYMPVNHCHSMWCFFTWQNHVLMVKKEAIKYAQQHATPRNWYIDTKKSNMEHWPKIIHQEKVNPFN